MTSYKSLSTFHITGRGQVYTVLNDKTRERDELSREITGTTVSIDGQEFIVVGVESWCIPIINEGVAIGLLVKPVQI